jgi:hypothetical protein
MPEPLRAFPRSFQIYAWIEVLAYMAAAAWAAPQATPLVTAGLIVIFAATGLVRPVSSPFGGIRDPNTGVIIVAALLWDPQDVLLGVGVGSFIGLLIFRRNELWRATTNGAGWGLPAAAAAAVAHRALAGAPHEIAPLAIAALLAVATYRFVNTEIFALFRSLRFGRPFLPEWFQTLTFQWSSQLLSAPLAVVLAAVANRAESLWSGLALTAACTLALPLTRQEYMYYNRTREMLDEIVEAVMRALEGADPAARTHAERVGALAVETGLRMGMSERGLLALRLASLLHDVGLIAGTGSSTGEGHHAAIGGRILAQFPDPLIGEFVREHHERWDGEGVPDHRRGRTILLGARILAAAEIYDSVRMGMAPDSPTSYARTADHLTALAGNSLDPEVVKVLLQVAAEPSDYLAATR